MRDKYITSKKSNNANLSDEINTLELPFISQRILHWILYVTYAKIVFRLKNIWG